MSRFYAWCTPYGTVFVSNASNIEHDAILLARSNSKAKLEHMVQGACRLMHNGTLAVPGMPEAGYVQYTDDGGIKAMVEEPTPEQVHAGKLRALNMFVAWLRHTSKGGIEFPACYVSMPMAAWVAPDAEEEEAMAKEARVHAAAEQPAKRH
jgi:hypothetical protein